MAASLDGILFGIGNPLLDISTHVGQDIFDKYELKPGNAILAEPKHLPLYDEIVSNYKVEYIAGGAAQNSIRAAQWLLQVPNATVYVGSVGKDANGKHIKDAAEEYGVHTHYMVDESKPTGTCAVLVKDKERSLVANLGAAESYKPSHFESKEIQELVHKAQFFYATGFFLTVSPDTLVAIGKHCKENNKTFVFGLAAPFLIEFFWEQMARVLPYVDIVCCNEDEAAVLGKKNNWGTDLVEVAKKLAEFPKENQLKKRMVIFTQGARETLVIQDGHTHKFHPLPVPSQEIVDTNGAGDSFMGGFLSQLVKGKPLDQCIAGGHYCASEVIRRSGATFPPKPHFHYDHKYHQKEDK